MHKPPEFAGKSRAIYEKIDSGFLTAGSLPLISRQPFLLPSLPYD